MEHELLTPQKHMGSPEVFNNVSVAQSLGHCIVCPSINSFWLPLWYIQTLITVLISMRAIYKNSELNNDLENKDNCKE